MHARPRTTVPTDRRAWLGEWCKGCDRRNVVGFSVSDEDWRAVVGNENAVLCLTCFDERAEARGVRYVVLDVVRPIAWWEWDEPGPRRRPRGKSEEESVTDDRSKPWLEPPPGYARHVFAPDRGPKEYWYELDGQPDHMDEAGALKFAWAHHDAIEARGIAKGMARARRDDGDLLIRPDGDGVCTLCKNPYGCGDQDCPGHFLSEWLEWAESRGAARAREEALQLVQETLDDITADQCSYDPGDPCGARDVWVCTDVIDAIAGLRADDDEDAFSARDRETTARALEEAAAAWWEQAERNDGLDCGPKDARDWLRDRAAQLRKGGE